MKIKNAVLMVIVLLGTWQAGLLPLLAADVEESNRAVNPLTVDPDLAIFTAVVFLLLLAFLTKFAWRPLMAGLDERERSIAQMIEEAKRGSEQAAEKLRQYEEKLQAASAETQEILVQARRDAHAAGDKMLADARAEADRERQRALGDIESAKNAAVKEIASQSADLAFTLARKMIHRDLKPEDHAALIRESLEQFPSEN